MKTRFGLIVPASCICLLLAAAQPTRIFAAETRTDQTVVIKADETIEDDLYVFGEKVTIEGTVKGDLIVFGGQIVIKGDVEGDIAAAGQTILIEGNVTDDVRFAGQVLKIASGAKVDGDVFGAGLSLELEGNAAVGGDVYYAGYQAALRGAIDGDVHGGMAHCALGGAIGGDVNVEVGGTDADPPPQQFGPPPPLAMPDVPHGLTVESAAKIDGKLTYSALREAKVANKESLVGGVNFKQQQAAAAAPPPTATEIALQQVRHFACVGVLGLAMILLMPRSSITLSDNIRRQPLASLLGGAGAIVLFFVLLAAIIVGAIVLAILFAMATLGELAAVTIAIGLLGCISLSGAFWLFSTYIAQVVASLAIGRLALTAPDRGQALAAFAVGLVVFALLCSIPYLGPAVAWIGMLLALGALLLCLIGYRRAEAPLKPAPAIGLKPVPA